MRLIYSLSCVPLIFYQCLKLKFTIFFCSNPKLLYNLRRHWYMPPNYPMYLCNIIDFLFLIKLSVINVGVNFDTFFIHCWIFLISNVMYINCSIMMQIYFWTVKNQCIFKLFLKLDTIFFSMQIWYLGYKRYWCIENDTHVFISQQTARVILILINFIFYNNFKFIT